MQPDHWRRNSKIMSKLALFLYYLWCQVMFQNFRQHSDAQFAFVKSPKPCGDFQKLLFFFFFSHLPICSFLARRNCKDLLVLLELSCCYDFFQIIRVQMCSNAFKHIGVFSLQLATLSPKPFRHRPRHSLGKK